MQSQSVLSFKSKKKRTLNSDLSDTISICKQIKQLKQSLRDDELIELNTNFVDVNVNIIQQNHHHHQQQQFSELSSSLYSSCLNNKLSVCSSQYIRVGNRDLLLGKQLISLIDSTSLYHLNLFSQLFIRLQQDGYLFIKGIINKDKIWKARQLLLQQLNIEGAITGEKEIKENRKGWKADIAKEDQQQEEVEKSKVLKNTKGKGNGKTKRSSNLRRLNRKNDWKEGVTCDAESGGLAGNRNPREGEQEKWSEIGTSKTLTDVYNGEDLHQFYSDLFTPCSSSLSPSSTCSSSSSCSSSSLPIHQPNCILSSSRILTGDRGATITPHYTTFPGCTWLRMKGQGEVTAEHTDYYYFKKESQIFTNHWEKQNTLTPSSSSSSSSSFSNSPSSSSSSIDDISICRICHIDSDPESVVLCDLCDSGYHTFCLTSPPSLPSKSEWHCFSCANSDFPYYTCWIALGDVKQEDGRLALVPGSHRLQGYQSDKKRDQLLPNEWKGNIERNAIWHSSDMEAGDLILFNVKTVHAASKNTSGKFRISLDTRVTTAKGNRWKEQKQDENEEE